MGNPTRKSLRTRGVNRTAAILFHQRLNPPSQRWIEPGYINLLRHALLESAKYNLVTVEAGYVASIELAGQAERLARDIELLCLLAGFLIKVSNF